MQRIGHGTRRRRSSPQRDRSHRRSQIAWRARRAGHFIAPDRGRHVGGVDPGIGPPLKMSDDDYVFDHASGEWLPKRQAATPASDIVEVRDAVGNLLADGDQVTLVKDLTVKGAGQTLKRGTLIKSIRLTGDAQEIDCKYEGIKGLVLRAEFVRKR